jgi:RecB family exonuclease
VIYKRPLPYVYLTRQIFPSAGVPFQAFDALPLAAEPYAALVDLLAECVDTDGSRTALVALLRSPHLSVQAGDRELSPRDIAALDRALAEGRYLAGPADLRRLVDTWADYGALARAGAVALAVVDSLVILREEAPPARHLDGLLGFLEAHERLPERAHPLRERHLRARGAVLQALTALRDAYARLDARPRSFADTMAAVRRRIERQTFSPRHGAAGVQLVDARAARFGAFDTLHLVGLTDREWPDSPDRNIFYPPSMLSHLGWPAEADVRASERAAFDDLIHAAELDVIASTITLEDEAIVEPSPFLEDLAQSGLPVTREPRAPEGRIFARDALLADPLERGAIGEEAAAWLALRVARSSASEPRYHGTADPVRKARHKVSAIDQYLACPFVYFASQVLRLDEEPDDEESLGPKAQGRFVHAVFEAFFLAWQERGRGAITTDTLEDARALFTDIVDAQLATLPESDAALQRTRLLGSPVAPGFGDVVFLAEAVRSHSAPVVERRMEFSLDGPTTLRAGGRTREVVLAAKADRVDLFADGTFRVVDYKLSKAPNLKHVVQLPAYAAAVRQRLDGYRGRQWQAADAAYIAFGKGGRYEPLTSNAAQLDAVLAAGEARLVEAVERIERGEFPPAPAEKRRCRTCPYSPVCRKDLVDDE